MPKKLDGMASFLNCKAFVIVTNEWCLTIVTVTDNESIKFQFFYTRIPHIVTNDNKYNQKSYQKCLTNVQDILSAQMTCACQNGYNNDDDYYIIIRMTVCRRRCSVNIYNIRQLTWL